MNRNSRNFSVWRLCLLVSALLATHVYAEQKIPPAPDKKVVPLFDQIKAKAAVLAKNEHVGSASQLPPFLSDLNYDQFRDIRFRPDYSLWRDEKLPFEAQFFSRGFTFNNRVLINIVENAVETPYNFDPGMFDFGRLPVPMEVPKDLGFAGFRLHHPINTHQYLDEVAAFLGASYFRSVGRRQVYGLSARGLAVDTGLPRGEEFPVFREYWFEKPAADARHLTVYALMDSPSVAGAYQFVITPGAETEIAVTLQLYFRRDVEKLGIAPLTSMFYHGKTTQHFVDDFRPEVHDSDGLLIEAANGEQIWRPLNNPQRLAFSNFQITNPRGFGLLQRERSFERYQDLEAKYERRPSAWITPVGDWGMGRVELVEIPSEGETDDNIVAFWVPAGAVTAGSTRAFEYTLSFGSIETDQLEGRTVFMGIGQKGIGQHRDRKRDERLFVLDFAGGALDLLPESTVVTAEVTASTGTLQPSVVERNPHTGGYRVFFEHTPGDEPLTELRCVLHAGDHVVSETWTYQSWKEKY